MPIQVSSYVIAGKRTGADTPEKARSHSPLTIGYKGVHWVMAQVHWLILKLLIESKIYRISEVDAMVMYLFRKIIVCAST